MSTSNSNDSCQWAPRNLAEWTSISPEIVTSINSTLGDVSKCHIEFSDIPYVLLMMQRQLLNKFGPFC